MKIYRAIYLRQNDEFVGFIETDLGNGFFFLKHFNKQFEFIMDNQKFYIAEIK